MAPILLTTLNARYSHCAFGLRYLYANLKELQPQSRVVEFTIAENARDIAAAILAHRPKVVGFGVYIWNARQTFDVVSVLKRLHPEIKIVLGGPEVSYETEAQEICRLADLTIQGEADFLFYEVCRDYFESGKWPAKKWVRGEPPEIKAIALPYSFYGDEDIRHRVLYVEASRGCPYKCEYCLSSLDKSVRGFDIDLFLAEMDKLIERGARQFKFVDRTFNLSSSTSSRILRFFLERVSKGLFLHFEMVPDRLPGELRELIQAFPRGSLQFEIGIQTWNPDVARLVSRRQDYAKVRDNLEFLAAKTGVHTHADLIAGLPGETLESFAQGFDAVYALGPDEIQVGILKRLRGTPIVRHDQEWQMTYQEHPPYQILKNRTMCFETIQRVERFSKFWDLIANSGNFENTMKLLERLALKRAEPSVFWEFDDLARLLAKRHPQAHGVALINLVESIWIYLKDHRTVDEEEARMTLLQDYALGTKRRDEPAFFKTAAAKALRAHSKHAAAVLKPAADSATPRRQQRHIANQLLDQQ